jgi:uncharacterized protein
MPILHRLLRKPFFGRFEVPWRWPDGTDRTTWERVTFTNPTRATLVGLWGAAHTEARGTLVLAHPMGKAAKGFWLRYGHAELFRNAGYNVLLFDANGFGESSASSFDYPADVLAAGTFAQQRTPHLGIGLVGASFGGGWGLCAMARAGSPFRVAVLEGVFPTLPEFWRHYPFAHAMLRLSQVVWPPMERGLRPEREAARLVGNPSVLFIYGEQDIYTTPSHGARLVRAMQHVASAEIHVLDNVEHTFAFRDATQRYSELTLPFLSALSAPTPLTSQSTQV